VALDDDVSIVDCVEVEGGGGSCNVFASVVCVSVVFASVVFASDVSASVKLD